MAASNQRVQICFLCATLNTPQKSLIIQNLSEDLRGQRAADV
jgi:hypothetical protein